MRTGLGRWSRIYRIRVIYTTHTHRRDGCDMDLIWRKWGVNSVVISGTSTENCCHATARDAMFHNYKVAFVCDATGTFGYPDVGWGVMSAADIHQTALTILAFGTSTQAARRPEWAIGSVQFTIELFAIGGQ